MLESQTSSSAIRTIAGILCLFIIGCSKPPPISANLTPKTAAKISVHSPQFADGQTIPAANTADGGSKPPEMSWTGEPPGTQSVALIVDDSDANGFVHWIVYNVPAGANKIDTGTPSGSAQGKNGQGGSEYYGPHPPPGKPHHYHFHVYALDSRLSLDPGASKDELLGAMSGHVLADGELVGVFESH